MSEKASKLRKTLLLAGKLAIAAGLLAWILTRLNWAEFLTTLKEANLLLICFALAGYVISLVIIGIRLWFLLRIQGIAIGLWEVVRLTFLGHFFNAIVPGTVGGDVVKAFYAAKHTDRKGAAVVTVFVDRLMGMTELAVLAGVMILIVLLGRKASFDEMRRPMFAVVAALAAVVMMLVFLLSPRVRRLLHLQKIYSRLPIAHHIESARQAAMRFRQNIGSLIIAVIITLAAHGTWIAAVLLIGESISLDVAWYKYFVYIPLIYIIGAIPITPGGIGLVEAFYILFFVTGTVGQTPVVALALLARMFDILRGLPGVIVLITGTRLPKAEAMEAELAMDSANGDQPAPMPSAEQSNGE